MCIKCSMELPRHICLNISSKFLMFIIITLELVLKNFIILSVSGVAATTFYYSGIKDWNSLPSDVKQNCTFNGFNSAASQYLRSQLQLMESDIYVYMHLVFQFAL